MTVPRNCTQKVQSRMNSGHIWCSTPLIVAATNAAGEPLALVCPICHTQYTLDGALIGHPTQILHLTASAEFVKAARRLNARTQPTGAQLSPVEEPT